MRTTVLAHAAAADMMSRLRAATTPSGEFRALIAELTTVLTVKSTSDLATRATSVTTPVGTANGDRIDNPVPLVVPILRAGVGMLDSFLRLIPAAEVGFLGLKRDETTRQPSMYMSRLPQDLTGRHVFVLDPMLATGGSLAFAIAQIMSRGAHHVTCLCIVAAPEGVAAVEHAVGDRSVDLYLVAVDDGLNDDGYIVPGLGDAGDRLFGLN